jgi:hypothetical protein
MQPTSKSKKSGRSTTKTLKIGSDAQQQKQKSNSDVKQLKQKNAGAAKQQKQKQPAREVGRKKHRGSANSGPRARKKTNGARQHSAKMRCTASTTVESTADDISAPAVTTASTDWLRNTVLDTSHHPKRNTKSTYN